MLVLSDSLRALLGLVAVRLVSMGLRSLFWKRSMAGAMSLRFPSLKPGRG
jgi:hypothetical protein